LLQVFVLTVKKIASETNRMLKKAFYDDTMSRVQLLNGIHVSSHQALAIFECSGPPSWDETGENVDNMLWVGYEECIYLMLATF